VVGFFRKCSLIHFATHGVFASFEIDGKRVEKGATFSVPDVFDMYRTSGKLRTELVVLNTCTRRRDSSNAGRRHRQAQR
jgi:CHAT domain-containing protein